MKENETIQKLFSLLKKDKFRNIVILIGISGIIIIYLSTLFTPKEKEMETKQEDTVFAAAEYEAELEKKLQRVVSAITGEETPEVMLTLERDTQYVYATDEKSSISEENGGDETKKTQSNHDIEKTYIILKDAQGNQHALPVTEIQPEVKGVVVVSQLANDSIIEEKIIYAMKTVLGVSSVKIYVVSQYN